MADGDVAAPAATPAAPTGELDSITALKVVLKKANIHDGLCRGLRECVKALHRREARLCVLAKSCNEPAYTKLINALCKQNNINLIVLPGADNKQLGEWAGLCKVDKEGVSRKIVGASCVVVKNFGETTPELEFLVNSFKTGAKQ